MHPANIGSEPMIYEGCPRHSTIMIFDETVRAGGRAGDLFSKKSFFEMCPKQSSYEFALVALGPKQPFIVISDAAVRLPKSGL